MSSHYHLTSGVLTVIYISIWKLQDIKSTGIKINISSRKMCISYPLGEKGEHVCNCSWDGFILLGGSMTTNALCLETGSCGSEWISVERVWTVVAY